MGSIPLPALSVRPPQTPDPLEGMGRILALRNAVQQGKMQEQSLVAAQQENQMRDTQMKDQQAMTQAMHEWDGKDLDALPPLVIKNGGSANAVMGLKSKMLDMKSKFADLAKTDAETNSKNLDTQLKQNDQIAGALGTTASLADADLPKGILDTAQKYFGNDPQHMQAAQALAQQAATDPESVRNQLKVIQKSFMGQSALMKQAGDEADIAYKQAQTKEATNRAALVDMQLKFGGNPELQKSRYQSILQKKASGQALSADDTAFARAYEAAQATSNTTSDNLGVVSTATHKPNGLASVGVRGGGSPATGTAATAPATGGGTPSGGTGNLKQSMVDAIGQYKMDPALLGRAIFKHPELLGAISQKYPDWDQTAYIAKNKLIQGYTSGTQSKEINAINTVAGHLNTLNDAIDALNNGNVNVLNSLANRVGAAVGQTPQTTFRTIVHRIGPEITTAYVQGGGGEAERFANAEDFSENKAPQQLKSNVAVTVKLLRSKIGALENQYKNTVGRDDFAQRFITPEAQASFTKLAGGGSASAQQHAPGAKVNLPEGTTGTGSDGKKYVVKGGTWVSQ